MFPHNCNGNTLNYLRSPMVQINQLNTSFYGKPESCSQQLKEINQKLQDMKNQLAREQAQKKRIRKRTR